MKRYEEDTFWIVSGHQLIGTRCGGAPTPAPVGGGAGSRSADHSLAHPEWFPGALDICLAMARVKTEM